MSKLDFSTDSFTSQLKGDIVVAHLKGKALDIVTNPHGNEEYFDLLKTADESPEVTGYVQINDGGWDRWAAVDELVELLQTDDKFASLGGRLYGYRHDLIAARFRHSLGRLLLTMIEFTKPIVAGMQGEISGEYLGYTLGYDARFATADTTFSFDSIRTGLPASPGITFLMPRYIGIGRTMSLLQSSSKINAQEAYSLGLISGVVDNSNELVEHCESIIQVSTASHRHLAAFHRQHILPSVAEAKAAVESYIEAMAKSIIQLRQSR